MRARFPCPRLLLPKLTAPIPPSFTLIHPQSAMSAAIEAAFLTGSDESFDSILEIASQFPASVNCAHPATGATALHAAVGKGREDVAFALLSKGADADICARNGSKADVCSLIAPLWPPGDRSALVQGRTDYIGPLRCAHSLQPRLTQSIELL